ncbi:MAG: YceI family protein [Chitinophagaceae bacterium]|nr:YceI family protein [Chitinophagaceae bacterium]
MSISIIKNLLTVMFLFTVTILQAQSYTAKSYKLVINGTSTMHDWSSNATNVKIEGDFTINNGTIEKINNGTVNVATKSIKSTKNSGIMDSRTHETLKADKFPNIIYTVTKIGSVQQNGNEATVVINGNLNIGGTSKPTDLTVKMKVLPNGDIEVKGTRKILMSTYGIKPPSFMLGALKVGDEVNLDFSAILHK